ncbi:MAG: hypothetical protein QXQ29_02625 [Candidatus Bathyarchaeia archaeon]
MEAEKHVILFVLATSSYFIRIQAEEAVKFVEAILEEARRIVGRREVEK